MKVTLQQLRSLGIFEDIEQPEIVYHLTSRENAESILRDGKVKTPGDFVCWFFVDLKWIPVYIAISGWDTTGRQYYGFDGKMHTDPPLDHANTVVLKLIPRRKEALAWYREHAISIEQTDDRSQSVLYLHYIDRICHYGEFSFNRDSAEIIELTEIDAKYQFENTAEGCAKFIAENGLEDDKKRYIEKYRRG